MMIQDHRAVANLSLDLPVFLFEKKKKMFYNSLKFNLEIDRNVDLVRVLVGEDLVYQAKHT